jgi:hypothetical protein
MKIPEQVAVLLPSIWEPLYDAFATLLVELQKGLRKSFVVSFEIDGFSPYPYIQAALNREGDFVVEFTSNLYLEPDLSRKQIERLDSIGWRKPNSRNPNYTKIVNGDQPASSLARYITTTLRIIYNLDESVWIVFGDVAEDYRAYSVDSFWHRMGKEGVVCLPGMNAEETIEGVC